MATITLSHGEHGQRATFSRGEGVPEHVWIRVRSAATAADDQAVSTSRSITLAWSTALTVLRSLAPLQRELGFAFRADASSAALIARFQSDVAAVRAGGAPASQVMSPEAIEQALQAHHWKAARPLKPYQMDNLVHLMGLANGANFSVPGAGKTTVTFALNLLTQGPDDVLLVVGPRNAFPAWEAVVDECLESGTTPSHEPFTTLVGGQRAIRTALASGGRRFIISYDQLARVPVPAVISQFMATHRTHLVLDESHRMKAGAAALRGAALLKMSHLPTRRDVLSGTPMPQRPADIGSQLDFLWPGTGLGHRITQGEPPRKVLGDLYVRTTKHQLALPTRTQVPVEVQLSDAHLALYSIMKSRFHARFSRLQEGQSARELQRARISVMRLLRAAVDPRVLARDLARADDEGQMQPLLAAVLAEGPSRRILKAVELAQSLAASGRKVLIWTIFSQTLAELQRLLAPLQPAVLHGGVAMGDEAIDDTRQGQIRRFKEDDRCKVMIANPAAASEGISLHMVCHDAIYVDRSYNAVHYLQSIDRIHRLGLPDDTVTTVYVLRNVLGPGVGSIDTSVSRRLAAKIESMHALLDDADLHALAIDEEVGSARIERLVDKRDIEDLLAEIEGRAGPVRQVDDN